MVKKNININKKNISKYLKSKCLNTIVCGQRLGSSFPETSSLFDVTSPFLALSPKAGTAVHAGNIQDGNSL